MPQCFAFGKPLPVEQASPRTAPRIFLVILSAQVRDTTLGFCVERQRTLAAFTIIGRVHCTKSLPYSGS